MLILDAISPLERVQISGQLAAKAKTLKSGVDALARIRLGKEVAQILKELGAQQGQEQELVFDLSKPEETAKSLGAYLDSGMPLVAEPLRAAEAETIAELASQLGNSELKWKAKGIAGELRQSFDKAFNELKSRGLKADIDHEKMLAQLEEAEQISKQSYTADPEWIALQEKLKTLNISIRQGLNELDPKLKTAQEAYRSAKQAGNADLARVAEDLIVSLAAQRKKAADEYSAAFNAAEKAADARAKEFQRERQEKVNAALREEGAAVVRAVMANSPVTAAQAMDWAKAQKIEAGAIKRLAKNGYPKEQVIQDLADFYQITGGKASAVSIINTGGKRAYATNIHTSTNEKIISIDSNFSRAILFHELAHHLENDPIAKAAANGYVEKRRESTTRYSLRSLTGNNGYRKDEWAYKDNFISPYMGKVYPDHSTEVFSLAVEFLANPYDAARMYAKDPELFALVSGYLGSRLTPAMNARLGLHSEKIEEKADLERQAIAAIGQAASGITLEQSDWFEKFRTADSWRAKYSVNRAGGDSEKMKTVGAYEPLGLYVVQGPIKSSYKGRKSKGFMVLRDTGGYPDAVFAGRTLEEAKALIAASIEYAGDIQMARVSYFANGATPEAVAKLKQLSQGGQ